MIIMPSRRSGQEPYQVIKREASELIDKFGITRSIISGNLQELHLSSFEKPVGYVIDSFYTNLKNKFDNFNQKSPQIIKGQFSELKNEFEITKSIFSGNLQKMHLGVIQRPLNKPIEIFEARLKEITDFVTIQLSISQMIIIDELKIKPSEETRYLAALKLSKELSAQDPTTYKPDIAKNQTNLGILYYKLGRFREAEEMYLAALKIYKELAVQNPSTYLPDLADTKINLGVLYRDLSKFNDSENTFIDALSIYNELAEKIPDSYLPRVAITQNNLGIIYTDLEWLDNAEEKFHSALKIYRKLEDQNPDMYKPDVAQIQDNLGILYYNLGIFEESETTYKEALETYRELANKNPEVYLPSFTDTQHNLGVIYAELGRADESKKLYHEALNTYKQLALKNPDAYLPKVATTQINFGNLNTKLGKLEEAEHLYKEASELFNQSDNLSGAAEAFKNIGQVYKSRGDLDEALYYFHESLSIFNKMRNMSGRAETLSHIGSTYKEGGDLIKALDFDNAAVEVMEHMGTKNDELEDEIKEIKKELPDVYFSVYSPALLSPGNKFMLKVYAYLWEQKSKVDQRACMGEKYKEKNQDGPISAKIGDPLSIHLDLPSPLELLHKKKKITCKEIAIASFGVTIPEILEIGPRFGEVKIKVGRSTKLKFEFVLDIKKGDNGMIEKYMS